MILIGSAAIKHWFKDFPREPKDTDYVVLKDKHYQSSPGIEYLNNKIIRDLYLEGDKCVSTGILDANSLLTLKASHLFWDINWDKHLFDVQFLLKKGCEINTSLFWNLYEYWNSYHGKNKRSDLEMSKDSFFDNTVNYDSGEHDFTHTLLNPIPTYTKVLKDNQEVELDKNKWLSLPFEDKLNFIREEVMVMAYERYKYLNFQQAYSRMLKKFIINHTPLFSVLFIIENYIILHKPTLNYFKIIENGRIKSIN